MRYLPIFLPLIFFGITFLFKKNYRAFEWHPVWIFSWFAVWLIYLLMPQFSDHNEPGLLAISWAWHRGQQLYHSLASNDAYSLLYGPLLFFINRISLFVFGLNKAAAHLQGLFFIGLSFLLLYDILKKSSAMGAHRIIIFCSLSLLAFGHYSLSNRSEPILFFLVTLSLWAQFLNSKMFGLFLLGLAMGVAFHVKIHSPIYMIPSWSLAIYRNDWRSILIPASIAALFAAAVVHISGMNVLHYSEWLLASSEHPRSLYHSLQVTVWAMFFCIPLFFCQKSFERKQKRLALALIVCLLLTLVFGSKAGSGAHHLLPLLPYLGYLYFSKSGTYPIALRALCLALVPLAFIKTIEVFSHSLQPALAPQKELIALLKNRPENRQYHLAYTKSYEYSKLRHLVVFNENLYWIDSASLMDRNLSQSYHLGLVPRLKNCEFDWLVPTSEKPFDLPSYYDKSQALFGEEFLRAFDTIYELKEAHQYFEIWSCRSPASGKLGAPR